MTDINDLVQEFCRTSSDVGASFLAMRCLLEIFRRIFVVCYFRFGDCIYLADKILQSPANDDSETPQFRAKFKILLYEYQKMFDHSFSKSRDLRDMLMFLPGVVVQKTMSMQGMADLYRIKPDLLGHLIKSIVESLRFSHDFSTSKYYRDIKLDDYLSSFLQDRDRSQHYYCDPMLQHISICRQILSLSYQSNVFDLQT